MQKEEEVMRRKLIDRVISLIPSKTIKSAIYAQKHNFSNIDLFKIIIEYANTLEEEISLLKELKNRCNDRDLSNVINKIITYNEKSLALLAKKDADYIYEVEIEESRYLSSTLEEAFNTFKTYLRAFKSFGGDTSSFMISKKRVANRLKVREIENDYDVIACAEYNAKCQVIRICNSPFKDPYYNNKYSDECINYPILFKKYDLVECAKIKGKYYISDGADSVVIDINDKERRFVINSFDQDNSDVACVLLMENEFVKYRAIDKKDDDGYYPFFMCHDHIDYGCLELVDIENVPENVKKDYKYIVDTCKRIDKLTEK